MKENICTNVWNFMGAKTRLQMVWVENMKQIQKLPFDRFRNLWLVYKSKSQNRQPNWLMPSALIKFRRFFSTSFKSLISDYVDEMCVCVFFSCSQNPTQKRVHAIWCYGPNQMFSIGSRIFALNSNCSHFKMYMNFYDRKCWYLLKSNETHHELTKQNRTIKKYLMHVSTCEETIFTWPSPE